MDHDRELVIARLEILEIEVCNILQNPGNIGKRIFSTSSYPRNIGKRSFFNFLISWKYCPPFASGLRNTLFTTKCFFGVVIQMLLKSDSGSI